MDIYRFMSVYGDPVSCVLSSLTGLTARTLEIFSY